MWVRVFYFFIFLFFYFFNVACSHINEDERLIYVEPAVPEPDVNTPQTVARTVLLEDFTGQRCANCPKGTEVIEQLMEVYGDNIVAVGIHGGDLGFKGTATIVGLATDMAEEYYTHWSIPYQPVGLIDRHGLVNYPEWAKVVAEELAVPSTLKMEAEATIEGGQIAVTVSTECLDGSIEGKLQVWVVEDGITAIQTMPDGKNNKEYVHNHVFRAAVNGTWGEDFTLVKGDTKTTHHTLSLDTSWNPERLSVVAFVYNDQGVVQTARNEKQ